MCRKWHIVQLAKIGENCYSAQQMAHCVVSYLDSEGLRHSVEVDAESLYEAAVLAVRTFKQHDCAPPEVTKLEVEIRSSVVHETTVKRVREWLTGGARSPKDAVLKGRLRALQISTDGLRAYVEAVENAFGSEVDYGMIIKNYGNDTGHHHQERRYSAPEIVFSEKQHVVGHPDMDLVSTSHIERLNGTTRLHMKRLARLTYAFSKKLESFEAAVALHFAYYNLVRSHGSLKMTPAMAAGVERKFWTVGDLIEATL